MQLFARYPRAALARNSQCLAAVSELESIHAVCGALVVLAGDPRVERRRRLVRARLVLCELTLRTFEIVRAIAHVG